MNPRFFTSSAAIVSLAGCLAACQCQSAGAAVTITLLPAASVVATPDHYIRLDCIAALKGGSADLRKKAAAVCVARAPFGGETRKITINDIALKLRQYGVDPDRDVVFQGNPSTTYALAAGTAPVSTVSTTTAETPVVPHTAAAAPVLVRAGDTVTLTISDGAIHITAPAVARASGTIGDTIRVHRPGVMTDLMAVVTGDHTASLEN